MFDIPIDDVPLFFSDGKDWNYELSAWFATMGKFVMPVQLPDETCIELFNDSLIITTINSPNPKVDRHAVITKSGRIIFDQMKGVVDLPMDSSMEAIFHLIGDIRSKEGKLKG